MRLPQIVHPCSQLYGHGYISRAASCALLRPQGTLEILPPSLPEVSLGQPAWAAS